MTAETITLDKLDPEALAALAAQAETATTVPTHGHTEAMHVGDADVPWVDVGDGTLIQLLQVDLNRNIWITRNKMRPGLKVVKHYHTGPVYAYTVQGSWFYEEYPQTVNRAGSFLFEPAGSAHTLCVPEDETAETIVWFMIEGANLNIDENGNVISIADAHNVLAGYRALCHLAGVSCDKVVVLGEEA
jgi:quercetin dioxygenase-like cupin family protein